MKTARSRADVVSSFTLIKGAMIKESYAVFEAWDAAKSKHDNLERLRSENFIGAKSITWLRDVAWVFNRRFDPDGRDKPLLVLAKGRCDLDVWKPILLWHITRDEFLFRDFLIHWLYPAFDSGAYRVKPVAIHAYLKTIAKRGGHTEHAWSESTLKRVSAGLLKMAADFGLLQGSVIKEFSSYHLPEASFLYLLHAMRDMHVSPRKVIDSADWRMYLMRRSDVEHELLRLHQFKKIDYQVAGSIVQLSLPCDTKAAFAERMVA